MNKKSLFIIGAIVVVVIIIAGIYIYNKPCVIASKDGQVTLEITKSVLPKHISKEQLVIKKTESKTFPFQVNNEEPLFVYSLEPGGLYFLKPVNFNIDIPIEEGMMPMLYNISEYGISRMNNVEITLDYDNKKANIKGQVEHFSYFYITQDAFTMSLTSPKEALVGEKVQVAGTTSIAKGATQWVLADNSGGNAFEKAMYRQWKEAAEVKGLYGNVEVGTMTFKKPWKISGKIDVNKGIVTPDSIDEAPAETEVAGDSYTFNGNFICKTPGLATFNYEVDIMAEIEIKWNVTPPFDINIEDSAKPMKIRQITHTECKAVPMGEEGIGGGGGGNGEDGDGEDGDGDEEEEDAEEEEELEGEDDECPDCDGLEEQLEELEAKKEELEKEIKNKEQELKDAEFTEEILDQEIDNVINDAGCNSNQDPGGGASQSGESSGSVTSRGRGFFCPSEAAAEALVNALKEFFKDVKTPSQVRHELRKLQKKMDKIDFDIQGLKTALEDCPCEKFEVGNLLMIEEDIMWGDQCQEFIKMLKLVPSIEGADSFQIKEDFAWLEFEPSEGSLPQDVDIKVNCKEVKKFEPGIIKAETEIEIFNKENKKIKGVPVNMIFGIMLIEGEEGSETTTGGPVVVGPSFIDFTYDHSNPMCPLNIEPVHVSGPVGGTWQVVSDPPLWLNFNQLSGNMPGQIDMNFPCRLDRYQNQEQSTSVQVETKTPDGKTETFEFKVNGKFINF